MCKQYSDIVVGIDIAGYENGHIYKTDKELLMVAAMEYCKENGINRTVHAGETPAGASSVKNVSFSVPVNISLILLRHYNFFNHNELATDTTLSKMNNYLNVSNVKIFT